jgi:hypothetical protein
VSKVAVHDVDHFVEGSFIRERLPTVAVIEREAVLASSEWCESEALIGAELVDSAQNEVACANFDREAARGFALIQQRLDSRHDGREPGHIWTAPSLGHSRQCATAREAAGSSQCWRVSVNQDLPGPPGSRLRSAARRYCSHAWTRRLDPVDAD